MNRPVTALLTKNDVDDIGELLVDRIGIGEEIIQRRLQHQSGR
ncbi:hypothetical protein KEK_07647 [Mycolicibacterium thermoresistibile ATCC 19527]|uniref:Uncharacterized protein n=1 Tax=Mycolicibacterium thermoresistibile (strain ATCC 19527 / DSM 44167 / CIP 105390 / JCM 6362 / NCTC 10409 / 316) TaxID=1078020 RepID=G7CEW0_MYCT3|nr:hypothetical protein KEK_07647 [Mycolicibacterium thermoresistibile ATCC 19527]